MEINWDNIKKILSDKNQEQIDKAKSEVLDSMYSIAKENGKKGVSVQGITAVTLAYNELELAKKPDDLVLLFKKDLLHTFIERQDMSLYRNPQQIREGDAIAIKCGKSSRTTYDVIKAGTKKFVVKPVSNMDGREFPEETIKVSGRSFILGIHRNKGKLLKPSVMFFFFI